MKTRLGKLIGIIGMAIASFGALAACNAPFVDYTHNGSVQLKLDYRNKNFLTDGIAQVNVKTYIDGDTTHFTQVGNDSVIIKARYYGIDTPESTGNIQPYGKQASNFTHEKLANAAANGTIVVSSPFSIGADGGAGRYGVPETDSTGGRYLSLVWINETVKNAAPDKLVLFNLWIVQEGLSWAKNTSEVPAFADTFSNAQKQAEQHKLKLWSDEVDPLYNYGDYETVSLLDIKQEINTFVHDPDYVNAYDGANVRFTGVVSGYCNHTLYVQEYYEDEDHPENEGQWAGINIFCGMSSVSSIYTEVGTYLEVVGKATDSSTFGFQIGDAQGHFPPSPSDDPSDVHILMSAEENTGIHAIKTFEYTPAQLNANGKNHNLENLFCRTKVTQPLTVERAYVNADGDEVTLYFKDCNFSAYLPFTYHGNPSDPGDTWMTEDKFVGKTFDVSGVYAYHKTAAGKINYQIVICGDSDLVCKTPNAGTVTAEPYSVAQMVANAGNVIENVTYYVSGKIGQVTKQNNVIKGFTLVDGANTINVTGATIPTELVAKILEGSVVKIKGVPTVSGGAVSFASATVMTAKKHGETIEDPLSVVEAISIASTLESGATTSDVVFVTGTVKTITVEYDTSDSKRMTFVITDGTTDFIISRARLDSAIDPTTIVIGTEVIVSAKLTKDAAVGPTTYYNGCKVVSVIA